MLRFDAPSASQSSELAALAPDVSLASAVAAPAHVGLTAAAEGPTLTPFLDEIVQRLAPLPHYLRAEVRQELRAHLESLIAAHEELGATREDAIGDAMRQFGDSRQIARRYRQAWRRTDAYERPWAAMRLALAAFSAAMVVTCAAIGIGARVLYATNQAGLARGAATARFAFLQFAFLLALLVVPILVGAWVGRRSPRRASFGTFCALFALTVVGMILWFLFGLETTGDANTLVWVFHQLCSMVGPFFVFWLPTGWLGASIASAMQTRRARRQRGLELSRRC